MSFEYWRSIENALKAKNVWGKQKVNPGAADDELTNLEKTVQQTLPETFKDFYRIHNGQAEINCFANGLIFGLRLLPINDIIDRWKGWIDISGGDYNEEFAEDMFSHPDGYMKKLYANPGWIPVTDDCEGCHLGFDYDPDVKGTKGQFIAFGRDTETKILLAATFEEFLDKYIRDLENRAWNIEAGGDWIFGDETLNGVLYHYWINGKIKVENFSIWD